MSLPLAKCLLVFLQNIIKLTFSQHSYFQQFNTSKPLLPSDYQLSKMCSSCNSLECMVDVPVFVVAPEIVV